MPKAWLIKSCNKCHKLACFDADHREEIGHVSGIAFVFVIALTGQGEIHGMQILFVQVYTVSLLH